MEMEEIHAQSSHEEKEKEDEEEEEKQKEDEEEEEKPLVYAQQSEAGMFLRQTLVSLPCIR